MRSLAEVERLRKMAESEEGFYSTANAVRGRFHDWGEAWWKVRQTVPGYDAGALREIGGMEGAMDEVKTNARVMLERLEKP